jgi:hypothetical protein
VPPWMSARSQNDGLRKKISRRCVWRSAKVPSVSKAADVRRLYSDLRALDRHELRRVLIYVKGLLVALNDDAGTAPGDADGGVTYRLEKVRCGKPGCASCPHGPYWYAYFREGNRLRSRYIGPELPAALRRGSSD